MKYLSRWVYYWTEDRKPKSLGILLDLIWIDSVVWDIIGINM